MKNKLMKKSLESDWRRVEQMLDDDIDTSDIPPLSSEFIKRMRVRWPNRCVLATPEVDSEVLNWYESQGSDYRTKIDGALRIYAAAHQTAP